MNNRARQIVGAGLYKQRGTVRLRNSIVAGSGSGDDCFGELDESRGNFSQDGTCATPEGGDPLLGELVGTPAYYPLRDASPAHGTADPAFCLPTDQVGNARTYCDIGAIESERAGGYAVVEKAAPPADCTLADQIIAANSDAPAGACPAGLGADTISVRENMVLDAPLPLITSEVTIDGKGHTVDGDNRFRVFEVVGGKAVFKNLRLINGSGAGDDGGAIYAHTASEILISNMTFANNHARSGGAVAVLGGSAGIYNSRFLDNSADDRGGAIWLTPPVTIRESLNSSATARPRGCRIGSDRRTRDAIRLWRQRWRYRRREVRQQYSRKPRPARYHHAALKGERLATAFSKQTRAFSLFITVTMLLAVAVERRWRPSAPWPITSGRRIRIRRWGAAPGARAMMSSRLPKTSR